MPAKSTDKPNPPHVKKSVSLPPDLMAAAVARAQREQRNFSSYIQKLIAQDLTPAAVAARGSAVQQEATA